MPTCIFKPVPDVDDDRYVEWSTVVDAPISFGCSRDYPVERVERARSAGASWIQDGDTSFWKDTHVVAVFNVVDDPPFPFGMVRHKDVYELARAMDNEDVDRVLSLIKEITD